MQHHLILLNYNGLMFHPKNKYIGNIKMQQNLKHADIELLMQVYKNLTCSCHIMNHVRVLKRSNLQKSAWYYYILQNYHTINI